MQMKVLLVVIAMCYGKVCFSNQIEIVISHRLPRHVQKM